MSRSQRPCRVHPPARIRNESGYGNACLRPGQGGGVVWVPAAVLVLLVLPLTLGADPRTEAAWSANPVRPGQPFSLSVTARWDGEANLYAVPMPKIDLPAEIQRRSVSSRSFREGEDHVVSYRWELAAPKRGAIAPIPIKLTVLSRGDQEPSEVSLETEPLVVDVARWRGVPVRFVVPSVAAAMIAIGVAGWLIGKRRSRLAAAAQPAPADRVTVLASLQDELNACRVRGDTRAFLDAAHRMLRLAPPPDRPESGEIASLLEQAKYGSLRLSSEEMEKWCQRLRRLASDECA